MRAYSVRAAKAELFDLARSLPPAAFVESMGLAKATPSVKARWARMATDVPAEPVAALGVAAGKRRGDYRLAVTVRSEEEAQVFLDEFGAEAEVTIVPEISPFPTGQWFQEKHRLEPGMQIKPGGRNWVGTAGFVAIDNATGRYVLVSNEHVLTAFGSVPMGTAVMQPRDGARNVIGVVGRRIPRMVGGARNRVDCAFAWLDENGDFWKAQAASIKDLTITNMRRPRLDDLGREASKSGRTTGSTVGVVRAVEKDALVVGTDRGQVWFDGQMSIVADGSPFSSPGDSGSAIFIGSELVGLLHAGGPDRAGADWTYACQAVEVCKALGVTPVMEAA